VELRFINDANTALSNMLSGAVQLLADDAIYFQQAAVLKRQWESSQAGRIVVTAGLWRYEDIQLGAEYNRAPALFDLRVRKALAYGLDRDAINTGVYDGEGIIADSVIPPTADYFSIVDRTLVKYPFDPRRTEQLMAEAGFTKGADGIYTNPASGRISLELKVTQSPQNESEQQIMAARWRELGFAIEQAVLPAAQAQDGQARATFPALYTNSTPAGDSMIALRGTANIPRAENRWNGPNRGHWTNADFDRLAAAYTRTLERDQRIQQIAQMLAIISDELPTISINFNPGITAFSSSLQGPAPVGPDSVVSWNVQNWQLQ
jgi:peptide/nickel transport system substrate-binding protein